MSISSTVAYWPASPMIDRIAFASRVTSSPATLARPASGKRSVVSTRTSVVFPAPFGPSSASTRPASADTLTLSRARVTPNLFESASTSIIGATVTWPPIERNGSVPFRQVCQMSTAHAHVSYRRLASASGQPPGLGSPAARPRGRDERKNDVIEDPPDKGAVDRLAGEQA